MEEIKISGELISVGSDRCGGDEIVVMVDDWPRLNINVSRAQCLEMTKHLYQRVEIVIRPLPNAPQKSV